MNTINLDAETTSEEFLRMVHLYSQFRIQRDGDDDQPDSIAYLRLTHTHVYLIYGIVDLREVLGNQKTFTYAWTTRSTFAAFLKQRYHTRSSLLTRIEILLSDAQQNGVFGMETMLTQRAALQKMLWVTPKQRHSHKTRAFA